MIVTSGDWAPIEHSLARDASVDVLADMYCMQDRLDLLLYPEKGHHVEPKNGTIGTPSTYCI